MIPISEQLEQELNQNVQSVLPRVKAWMSDLRYVENAKFTSTSHSYDKQILDLNPVMYTKFDKTAYDALPYQGKHRIQDSGSAALSFVYGVPAGSQYVYLPAVLDNFITTPHTTGAGGNSFSADIDLRVQVALDEWESPSGNQTFIAKAGSSTSKSFIFYMNTSRNLVLQTSTNGTNTVTGTSNASISLNNGDVKWVRAVLDISFNFATQRRYFFYTSDDGATWTQLGTTVTSTGATTLRTADTTAVELGSKFNGTTDLLKGKVFKGQLYNGIAGTLINNFDADLFGTANDQQVTASTGEIWTVYKSPSGARSEIYINQPINYDPSGVNTALQHFEMTEKAVEILEPNRLIDTFNKGSIVKGTCTISNGNPAVVTFTNHGLTPGDPVLFQTTGALPDGITPGVIYYMQQNTTNPANTFRLNANKFNAIAGSATLRIATTSAGSGTHSLILPTNKLGYFTKNNSIDTSDSDMSNYWWRFSENSNWLSTGTAATWVQNEKYVVEPVYITVDTRSLDHFVDFKFVPDTGYSGCGAIVRYVDKNNYISCFVDFSGGGQAIFINVIADGLLRENFYIESASMNTTDYYRFEAKYNQFTLYNMGSTEPTSASTGTIVSGTNGDVTLYCDIEIFRSRNATSVGLLNESFSGYNFAVSAGGTTFYFDYFASSSKNYLIAGAKFVDNKYVYASTDSGNTLDQFALLNDIENDFSYSFLFTPINDGTADEQTIYWFGNNLGAVAAHIVFDNSSGELITRIYDSGSTEYTLTSTTALNFDEMYHVAVIKRGRDLSLYINTVEEDTATLSVDTTKSIVGSNIPYIIFGYDQDSTHPGDYLNGKLANFAFFDYALDELDLESLYLFVENEGTLPVETSDSYFYADHIANGIPEETFTYAFTNFKNTYGDILKANNNTYCTTPKNIAGEALFIEDNFGWMSRVESDSSGDFANPDFIQMSFDGLNCNKIFIATGYYYGGIKSFDFDIATSAGVISGSKNFDGSSVVYIDWEDLNLQSADDYTVVSAIKITPTATNNPEDYARIFSVNPIWEVDLSQYVVSFSVDKVRDNLDASLPIGATGANNGSIVFDNTSLIFNRYGNSIYKDYINPDTKMFIYLEHDIRDYGTVESIPVAEEVFVDTWSIDNTSMTVSADFRDFSKFLQEENTPGYVSQGLSAGRTIRDIMLLAGFPKRRIVYSDKYSEVIFEDNPKIFIPFNETVAELTTSGAKSEDVYHADDCGFAYGWNDNPNPNQSGSTLVYSELVIAQDEQVRFQDELDLQTFYPTIKIGSLGADTSIKTLPVNASSHTKWSDIANDYADWTLSIIHFNNSTPSDEPIFSYDDNTNYYIKLEVDNIPTSIGKVEYRLYINDLVSNIITSGEYSESDSHLIHVVKTGNSASSVNTFTLYIDGNNEGSVTVSLDVSFPTNPDFKLFGQSSDYYYSNFIYYDYALPSDRVTAHYKAFKSSIIPVFRYLYATDATYWDSMLNIATADLGMFYFDEYGVFRYEYRNTFHNFDTDRYQTVQYNLSDDTNIISGDLVSEVQTNRVIVKVNKISGYGETDQSLWAAESGESLAVTSITADISPYSTSIPMKNISNPIWLPSGYVKIDDEIIKYNAIIDGNLINLERGYFDTAVSWHSEGSRAREARLYVAEYTNKPAIAVKYPAVTQEFFEGNVSIDRYNLNAFSAEVVVSLNDPGPPVFTEDGIDFYYERGSSYSNVAILEGSDPLTDDDNFFRIAGLSVSTEQSKETITEYSQLLQENIRRYRLKEITIDNEFIGNKEYAQIIAKHIIGYFSDPVQVLNINITAVPNLQLGDLVNIEQFVDFGIVNRKYWVIQSGISYDGGVAQNLILREYADTIDPPELNFKRSDGIVYLA